ncbi:MAG: hypothetical protein IKN04_13430 [Clostridia bacterium]|nr:hypothetical protein [Clostridia bacterium]
MLIKDLAAEIHQNAVAHGWWEEERPLEEVIVLIHSEWSEALEEARAGRPMVWYKAVTADDDCGGGGACNAEIVFGICKGKNGKCWKHHKPEGIAVELIDGCIRILDYFGKVGLIAKDAETGEELSIEGEYNDPAMLPLVPDSLVVLIANLHAATSYALQNEKDTQYGLITALSMAMVWVKKNGIDPLLLLMEKHEYNKTRPYKHGKQF